ncbi:GNAT family N-acetyltransferase [Streptococcus gallinaceus]
MVFIGFFMVDCHQSGKGIGTNILKEMLVGLRNNGFCYARLGYMAGNQQSQNFWEKCGFVETGIQIKNDQGIVIVLSREL